MVRSRQEAGVYKDRGGRGLYRPCLEYTQTRKAHASLLLFQAVIAVGKIKNGRGQQRLSWRNQAASDGYRKFGTSRSLVDCASPGARSLQGLHNVACRHPSDRMTSHSCSERKREVVRGRHQLQCCGAAPGAKEGLLEQSGHGGV
ncbi:hypothetical protein MRX96_034734 [Rhipicephalus microplus]